MHSQTRHLYTRLAGMKHSNGEPLCEIFGRHEHPAPEQVQGGILNFEVKDPEGRIVSYKLVEKEAASQGFHIRTGAISGTAAPHQLPTLGSGTCLFPELGVRSMRETAEAQHGASMHACLHSTSIRTGCKPRLVLVC